MNIKFGIYALTIFLSVVVFPLSGKEIDSSISGLVTTINELIDSGKKPHLINLIKDTGGYKISDSDDPVKIEDMGILVTKVQKKFPEKYMVVIISPISLTKGLEKEVGDAIAEKFDGDFTILAVGSNRGQ